MLSPVERLEEKIGYRFTNRELLLRALTHRSCAAERNPSAPEEHDNEQLEFLGDSVLGFLVSEALVKRHPAATEGQLSRWKSHLVSAAHLHKCALAVELGEHLRLGKGEERNGGRFRRNLLANAFEALIAAIQIDGGLEIARKFIDERVLTEFDKLSKKDIELLNHKSVLQERIQAMGLPIPRYSTVATSGPEHAKTFTVEARAGNFTGRASGPSKKAASQLAAEDLIAQLDAANSPTQQAE